MGFTIGVFIGMCIIIFILSFITIIEMLREQKIEKAIDEFFTEDEEEKL